MAQRHPQPIKRDDRAMISDPTRWPRWPWLPVKRTNSNGLQCAVVHADKNGVPYPEHNTSEIDVFATNMCEIKNYFPTREMVASATRYPSIDAMLADGWVVD